MWDYVLLALVFLFVFGLTMFGYLILNRRRQRIEERLQRPAGSDPMLGSDPSIGSTPELLLGEDLTPALAATVPMGQDDRGALQRELRSAGYYKPTAVMEYAALRAVLIILPLIMAGVFALLTESVGDLIWIWGGAVLISILGFSLPRVWLYFRAKARQHVIERGLPTAIDMLTLCLSAGLNVINSLQRVTTELHLAYPVLAFELEIVRRQSELRSLEFALVQFADRVGMPQIRNLSVLLTQSENLGTDAIGVLREYADNLRINMRQRADEMANKAPFKLLFPAYMMAFGAGIILISPVVLEWQSFRRTNLIGNEIGRNRELIKQPATDTRNAPKKQEEQ